MKFLAKSFAVCSLLLTAPLSAEPAVHLGEVEVCVKGGDEAAQIALAHRIKAAFEQMSSVRWLISEPLVNWPLGQVIRQGCEFTGLGCPESFATFSVGFDPKVSAEQDRITLVAQALHGLESMTSCGSFKIDL